MKLSLYSRVLLLGLLITARVYGQSYLLNPPPVNVSQTAANIGGMEHFAIAVESEIGLKYTLQVMDETGVWADSMAFDGIDDTITLPLVAPTNSSSSGSASLPFSLFKIQAVDSGGALIHWNSLSTGELVTYFDNSLPAFLATSAGFPPFSYETASNIFLIVSTGPVYTQAVAPNGQLGPEDDALLQAFRASYPNLASPAPEDEVVLAAQASGTRSIVRIKVEVTDTDRDGIPDKTETEIGTDPQSSDTDGDGVWDGKEVVDGTDPTKNETPAGTGNGGGSLVPIFGVNVEKISFFENHELCNDKATVRYRDPQWVRGSHSYPVCYKREDEMTISAIFSIAEDATGATVSFVAPDGIKIVSKPLDKVVGSSNLYELKKVKCEGAFPEVVRLYGKPPEEGEDQEYFTIDWEIEIPSASGAAPVTHNLTTNHTVYVTHDTPSIIKTTTSVGPISWVLRQESLFYHGCVEVDGLAITADGANQAGFTQVDFVKAIYGGFRDRFVAKVEPATAVEDTVPMAYYGDINGDGLPDAEEAIKITTAYGILTMEGAGNGQCSAWADLFYATSKIHGPIDVGYMKIIPAKSNEDTFAVKNMIWDGQSVTGSSSIAHYPFLLNTDFEEVSASNIVGLPGQGRYGSDPATSDPNKLFTFHNIVWIDGTIFDPSYGSPSITPSNGEDEFNLYENEYLELFGLKPLHTSSPTQNFRGNKQTDFSELKVFRIKPQP